MHFQFSILTTKRSLQLWGSPLIRFIKKPLLPPNRREHVWDRRIEDCPTELCHLIWFMIFFKNLNLMLELVVWYKLDEFRCSYWGIIGYSPVRGRILALRLRTTAFQTWTFMPCYCWPASEGYLKTVIRIILHLGRTRLPRLLPMSPKVALLIRRAKYG